MEVFGGVEKIGMIFCSAVLHPDLWCKYKAKVDLMVVMFSPGNTAQSELIFLDGYRQAFPEFEQAVRPSGLRTYPGFEVMEKFFTWIPVPMISPGGTGVVLTELPGLEDLLDRSIFSGNRWVAKRCQR